MLQELVKMDQVRLLDYDLDLDYDYWTYRMYVCVCTRRELAFNRGFAHEYQMT